MIVSPLLQVTEHDCLESIAKDFDIPYQHLMALQRNNKGVHHTVILERFCSTTQDSNIALG